MINKTLFLFFSVFLLGYGKIFSQQIEQKTNSSEIVFSEENLLLSWPDDGPEMVLMIDDIGNGYSSPVVTSDRIFVSGEIDSIGYIFAFKLNGELLWKKEYGEEYTISFQGARARPVLVDDLLYLSSGLGKIICINAQNGKEVWSVDMIKDLGADLISFGFSTPVFIHENMLFCSPGSKKNNVVALDRFTGSLIWASEGNGEAPGYGSNILIKLEKRNVLVTFSEYSLLGFDAGNGEFLWDYKLADLGEVPCNTPIYEDESIYFVAGPGNGATKLKLLKDGSKVRKVWHNIKFDSFFGGFIKLGEYLYGSTNNKPFWYSLNAKSGKMGERLNFFKGAVSFADGKIYAYNQRGQVALIKPDKEKMELISSFKILKGSKEHYAIPVIKNGILYIRHGDVLLGYNIKMS